MSGSYAKFRKKVITPILQAIGKSATVNTQSVVVTERNSAGLIKEANGTVAITNGGSGYAKGCLYTKTDVAAGSQGLYVNIGITTSCQFVVVATA